MIGQGGVHGCTGENINPAPPPSFFLITIIIVTVIIVVFWCLITWRSRNHCIAEYNIALTHPVFLTSLTGTFQ